MRGENGGTPITRRDFLLATSAAAVASALPAAAAPLSVTPAAPAVIDTNVSLARWPFRRLPADETPELVARLRGNGVTQAWAGSFDGLLHRDLASANSRLAAECRQHGQGLLIPFGSVNPTLPDWEDDLRRCHEEHRMPGIRLHPNYHGYRLDDPAFARLLALADERGLIVQLAASMEDDRTQHPLVRVPDVDTKPLPALLKQHPRLRLVLLNWTRSVRGQPLLQLVAAGRVSFDIATLEGVGGVANLAKQIPLDRIVVGSHAPFYYLEAALLKLKESPLTPEQLAAISHDNARKLLAA